MQATPEDYLVLIIAIAVVYASISFLQKKLKVIMKNQSMLMKWGNEVDLNDRQKQFLVELWLAYLRKQQPEEEIFKSINYEELKQIKVLSSYEAPPEELRASRKKRKKTEEEIKKLGYTDEQVFILSGIITNKLAGVQAIKPYSFHKR